MIHIPTKKAIIDIAATSESLSTIVGDDSLIEKHREKILSATRQQGYEEGYDKGFALGKKEGCGNLQAIFNSIEKRLSTLENEYRTFLDEQQNKVAQLVIAVVEHLLQQEIGSGHYSIDKIIGMALNELSLKPGLKILEVHCHPEDARTLEKIIGESMTIVADETIARADCCFKTNLGQVYSSLEKRLEQLKDLIKEGI